MSLGAEGNHNPHHGIRVEVSMASSSSSLSSKYKSSAHVQLTKWLQATTIVVLNALGYIGFKVNHQYFLNMEIWRWSQRAATWKNTCGHSRETLTPTISSNRWRSLSESEAASCLTSDWWLWIIVGEVQRFKGKLEQIEYFSGQLIWRLLQPVFKWTVAEGNVFLIIMEDHSCTMLSLLKEWNKYKPTHYIGSPLPK